MKPISLPALLALFSLAVLAPAVAAADAPRTAPQAEAPRDCAMTPAPAEAETPAEPEVPAAPEIQAAANWTFEGCFAFFASGPCLDAYRDSSGNIWICKACGTTKKPGPGQCQLLTTSGFWCS